jgi:hypothetical protein
MDLVPADIELRSLLECELHFIKIVHTRYFLDFVS